MRVGVASIVQESNTFSPRPTRIDDFESQGILEGAALLALEGTNTEAGGAIAKLRELRTEPVPVLRAWAMSGGPLQAETFDYLRRRLDDALLAAMPLDGLVLSLHGALVAEHLDAADHGLLVAARAAVRDVPVGVCLDLHANVTAGLVDEATFVIGFLTYPHIDMAETGARAAALLVETLRGRVTPITRLAKRPLLIPAEAQGTDGPFGELRRRAAEAVVRPVLDVSLFPVQPWLDVPELGYGVTVTTDAEAPRAAEIAEALADDAWAMRQAFAIDLHEPEAALHEARANPTRPVLLVESADSPTAGATAESPAMIDALLRHGQDLRALLAVVDVEAVAQCFDHDEGESIDLTLGAKVETRFHAPVQVHATIAKLGNGRYRLRGPVFTGVEFNMGRFARLDTGKLSILVSERPACTYDPEAFRHAGIDPAGADVVVVRSAYMYKAGWADITNQSIVLDLPGASTPKLASLVYAKAPHPLYPVDQPSEEE